MTDEPIPFKKPMSLNSNAPDTTLPQEPADTVLTDALFSVMVARQGSRAFNEEFLPPVTQEPSDLVKSSLYLMELLRLGMDSREVERRAQGAKRLKEAFSSILWHSQRAAKDPDYWNKLNHTGFRGGSTPERIES